MKEMLNLDLSMVGLEPGSEANPLSVFHKSVVELLYALIWKFSLGNGGLGCLKESAEVTLEF